jgi:hypothetical protein
MIEVGESLLESQKQFNELLVGGLVGDDIPPLERRQASEPPGDEVCGLNDA